MDRRHLAGAICGKSGGFVSPSALLINGPNSSLIKHKVDFIHLFALSRSRTSLNEKVDGVWHPRGNHFGRAGIIAAWIANPEIVQARAAGYDERQRTMEIEFANGDVYEYKAVSPELFRQLMASPLTKQFFEDKIEEAFSGKRIGKVSKTNAAADFDALLAANQTTNERRPLS